MYATGVHVWSTTGRGVCCFKQKTAYEMRISDWSSDVCSSDLNLVKPELPERPVGYRPVSDLEGELAAAQAYEKEKARLEAVIAQAGEEPAVPVAPNVDVADLEGRAEAARSAKQAQASRLAELDRKSTRLNSSH